eukprot:evm.model.scf_661.4 EVM.evm.TU.scf_661.4   scf_661:9371-18624(+)
MDGGSGGLQRVLSRPFLLRCLSDTGLEEDIVEDIADVCEAHELSALSLARQALPLKEASDKLFLTNREVEVLFEVCKKLCLEEGVSLDDKGVESPPAGPVKHVVEVVRGTPVAASPTRSCGAFSVGRLSVDGVDAYSVGKLSAEAADEPALAVDTDSCDSCGEEEIERLQIAHEEPAEEWADRADAVRSPEPARDRVWEVPRESPFTDDGGRSPFRSPADRCPFPLEEEEPSEPAVVGDAPLEADDSYVGEREEYRPLSLNAEDIAEEEYVPTGSTDSCIISELEATLDHAAGPEEAPPAGDPSTPCSIGQLVAVQSFQGEPGKDPTSSHAEGKAGVEPNDERPPQCPEPTHEAPVEEEADDDCASELLDEVPPSLSEFGEDFLRTGGTERGVSELSTSELDLVEIGREGANRRVVEDGEALQLDLSGVVAKEARRSSEERPSVPCNRAPTPFPAESARTKKRRDALALGHVLLRAQGAGLDLDLEEDVTTAPGGQERGQRQDAEQGEAVTMGEGGEVCSSSYQPDSKPLLAVRAPGQFGGLPRSAPVPRKVGEGLMVRTGAYSSKREDTSSPQSEGSPTAAQVVVNTKMPRRPMASSVPVVEQHSFQEGSCAYRTAFDGGSRCVESKEPEVAAECAKKSHSLEVVRGKESMSGTRGSFEGYEFSCPASFIPRGPTTPDVEDVKCTPVRVRSERDNMAIPPDRGQLNCLPSNSDSNASKMSKLAMKGKEAGGLYASESSTSRIEDGLQCCGKADAIVCGDRRSRMPRTIRATATPAGAEGVTSVAMEEKKDLLQWFEDPPMVRPFAPKPMSIRRSHRSATGTQDKRSLIHSAPAEQEVRSPVAPCKESMMPIHVNAAEKSSLYQGGSDCGAVMSGPCDSQEKIIAPADVRVKEEKTATPVAVCVKGKKSIALVAVSAKKELNTVPVQALHVSALPSAESTGGASGFEGSCLGGDDFPHVEAGGDMVKDSRLIPGGSVAVEVPERKGIGRMMMKESVAVREAEASGQKPRGILPRMSVGGFALEKKEDPAIETAVDGASKQGIIHTKIPTQPVRPGGAAVKGIMLSTEARRSAAVTHTHAYKEKAVPKSIDATKKMVQQCTAKVVAVRGEPVVATVGVATKENALSKAPDSKGQQSTVEDVTRVTEHELGTVDAPAEKKTEGALALRAVKEESTVPKIAEAGEEKKAATDAGDGAVPVISAQNNVIPKTPQASKAGNTQPDVVANEVKGTRKEKAAVMAGMEVSVPELVEAPKPMKIRKGSAASGGDSKVDCATYGTAASTDTTATRFVEVPKVANAEDRQAPSENERRAEPMELAAVSGIEIAIPEFVEAPKPMKIQKRVAASKHGSKVENTETMASVAVVSQEIASPKVRETPKVVDADDHPLHSEIERNAKVAASTAVAREESVSSKVAQAPKAQKARRHVAVGEADGKVRAVMAAEIAGRGMPEATKETAIRASAPESTEDKKPAAAAGSVRKVAILPTQVTPVKKSYAQKVNMGGTKKEMTKTPGDQEKATGAEDEAGQKKETTTTVAVAQKADLHSKSSDAEDPQCLPSEFIAVQTGDVQQDSKEPAETGNHGQDCTSAKPDAKEVELLDVPVETGVAGSPLATLASLEVSVSNASSSVQVDGNSSMTEVPVETVVSSHPVELEEVENDIVDVEPSVVLESQISVEACSGAQQPVAAASPRDGSTATTSGQIVGAVFARGPELSAAASTSEPSTAATVKNLASCGASGECTLTQEPGSSAPVTSSTENGKVECTAVFTDPRQSVREETVKPTEGGEGTSECMPKMDTQPASNEPLIDSSAADCREPASACGVASAVEDVIPPGDEQWLKEQTDAVLKRLNFEASSPRPGVGRRKLPGMWEDGECMHSSKKRGSKNVRGGRAARAEARPAFDSRPVRKPGLFNPSEDDIPGARRRREAAMAGEPSELQHAAIPSAASMRPAVSHMGMMHSQPVRTAPVHTAVHGLPKRTPSQVAAVRATPTRAAGTRAPSTRGGGTAGTRGGRTAGASRGGPARSTVTRASSGYGRRESLIPKSTKIPQNMQSMQMHMEIAVTGEAGGAQAGEAKTSSRGLPTPVAQALRKQNAQGKVSPEVRNRSPKPAKATPGKEPASIRALLKRDAAPSAGMASKKPSTGMDPKAAKSVKKTSQPRAPAVSPSIPRCAQTASRKNTLSPSGGSTRPKSSTGTLSQLRTAPGRMKERSASKCVAASRPSVSCSKKIEAEMEVQPQRGASITSTAGWQPPVPQRVRPSQTPPQQAEKPVKPHRGVRASTEEVYYLQVKEAEAAKKRQSQVKTKTTTTRTSTGSSVSRNAGHKIERHISVERRERSKVQVTRTVVKTYTERKQGSKVIREREEKITRVSAPARVPQFVKATVAHSPKLASAARAHHWKQVIAPKKQEKMEDLQKKQEEKRAKELEARDRVVKWTRDTIIFKTGDLPDFGECLEGDMEAAALDAMDGDDMDQDDMGHNGMDPDDMD